LTLLSTCLGAERLAAFAIEQSVVHLWEAFGVPGKIGMKVHLHTFRTLSARRSFVAARTVLRDLCSLGPQYLSGGQKREESL